MYHGTDLISFVEIAESGYIKCNYDDDECIVSCASDDFFYAKTYALDGRKCGVVLEYKEKLGFSVKNWIIYFFNRYVVRRFIFNNEIKGDKYLEIANNTFGFCENSIEVDVPNVRLDKCKIHYVHN